MMHRKLIINIIFTILLTSTYNAIGQKNLGNLFTNNEARGDAMYNDLYYAEAITYYKLALKKSDENKALQLKIARSYRMISDYQSSLEWYEKAFANNEVSGDPLHSLFYGDDLVAARRYDDAHKHYVKFWSMAPTDSRATRKLESLEQIELLKMDSALLNVKNAGFNSSYNDLAAIKFDEGYIFLSSRPVAALIDQDFLREENLLDFFYANFDSTLGWSESKRLKAGLNSGFFEGPGTITSDGREMVFSRSNLVLGKPITNDEGKTQLQLYEASRIGNEWVVGQKLSFCDSEYSYVHPALNETGDTLYFSSDMTGGYGGNDLYMSVKKNNEWSSPMNLGYILNTEGNELYPYFTDGRLFFSSNGYGGLGGLDVHKAYMANGRVKNVVNLGMPVNSVYDDFAFAIDKQTLRGTFTSNRPGGEGNDDVYIFETLARVLSGIVVQEQNGSRIADAVVELNSNGRLVDKIQTDEMGEFRFQLPLGQDFEVEVTKDGHRTALPVYVPNRMGNIDLDSLVIRLRKDDLFARGRILNNETQQLMDQVRVVLHNSTDHSFDTLITDREGVYNFVIQPNKNYDIWASKAGFIFGDASINTFKIDSGVINNDIVLEMEYEKKSIVHFEFDKFDLSAEAREILSRTAAAMRRTRHQLIISAYADARGTVEYNQDLSDKRAKEVLEYFLSQGIDRSRIIARGFGEALILNRCVDGVECEEVEHSKNRRAEIKIEGSTVR